MANCHCLTEGTAEEVKDILMPDLQKLFDKGNGEKKGSISDFVSTFLTPVQHESVPSGSAAFTYCSCPPEDIYREMPQHVVKTACSATRSLR